MKPLASALALMGMVVVGAMMVPAYGGTADKDPGDSHSFWRYVSKSGDIKRPADELVRTDWAHLGTWAIPKLPGAMGPGMHDVYTERWVLDAFNKTHKWPDGAVLVKQVHDISEGSRTTGPVLYWEGGIDVWFVMVKDNENRFPEDARWAEGWGWALFKADHPDTNISTSWKGPGLSNCQGCHIPAQNTGWVYLEGYPVLHLTADQRKAAAAH